MKISPLSQGTGVAGADIGAVSTGRTSPDRIAAAKAIASGQQPQQNPQTIDPQVERMNIRKIKMRTQVSPDRMEEMPMEEPESAITDTLEQPESQESEVTKPLSPQFAALAKQKRALQLKEREIEAREKALSESANKDGGAIDLARLKSDPLGLLAEAGVSYEQLTEAILNGQADPKIAALEAKIAALEKGVDTKFTDRDTQAEQQVLSEMQREADRFVAEGDDFALVRETRSSKRAIELIHRTYKESGEVMDVREALQLIEDELVNESLKRARISKIQAQLTPAQEDAIQAQQQSANGRQQMKTLTNRDSARPVLDKRARAIAAMNGTLKR